MKRECRHVVAENDLLRAGGIVEIRHGSVGFIQDFIGSDTGGEGSLMVGIAFQQILVDAFQRLSGDLRTARIVEKDSRTIKRRKLASDDFSV